MRVQHARKGEVFKMLLSIVVDGLMMLLELVVATTPPTLGVALEPWCNDSIRIRVYPGPVQGLLEYYNPG